MAWTCNLNPGKVETDRSPWLHTLWGGGEKGRHQGGQTSLTNYTQG